MPAKTIPNDSTYDVISYTILSDGKAIDPGYQLKYLSVSKEVNRIPIAKMVFRDGEAAERTFEISDSKDFIPGKKIAIKLGRDSKNDVVFEGIITKHAISIQRNGSSSLRVEARDASVKLTIGRHNKYFEKVKDSEAIEEIIGQYSGVKKKVKATKVKHQELVQHHATDWDFILSRADVNGMLTIVDDGTITIEPPDTSSAPKLTLAFGQDIVECEAEMDARTQWESVKAQSWDYKKQALFESQASSAKFKEHGNITGKKLSETIGLKDFELRHSGHVLEQELKEWADACMLKSRLAKIRGRARVVTGVADIKPGDMVQLEGIGERFNGNAYVTAVKQELSPGKWDTHIQFGLSPDWFASREEIVDFSAAGLVPAIQGLQIGKVVELEKDPDGENRILVRLPIIDSKAKGIWARVSTLDAGKERGSFFLPEIGDEVIVGFINDDPRDAVVLGMVHSSANPAPIVAKNDNHEKGFTTRSKMHLLFNDDTKTITIDTPAGNSIVIDEKGKSIVITDQNKNKVSMEQKGITVDSPKEITINGGTNINITAKANLKIEATKIDIKAKANLKAEGSLAELSASGITTVKGSLVKIN